MSTSTTTSNAPVFYFNGLSIRATYSFSEYKKTGTATKPGKIYLDLVFPHPIKGETVTVRASKSARLLNQPKEVIDAIAQRDVKDFLSLYL
ncbi:MAG: hypothetical protein ABIN89_10030 [Chitinophagaceae bacterium]